MAYFHGQYGHYPQTGFGNQSFPQYNNYSNTGTSDAQANYGYSNPSASGGQQSQTSSQNYSGNSQQYNYGYSSASSATTATSTTTSQQGTTYQQFSLDSFTSNNLEKSANIVSRHVSVKKNLWYNQVSSAQPNQTQQSTSQQQQGNRAANQQYTAAAYQAQMNQYYQQQSSYSQQQQQQPYQQGSQPSQQFKQPSKAQQSTGAQQSQQASSTSASNQASGEWSTNAGNQQRSSEAYSAYTPQGKPSASQSWSSYSPQQGGKDWASQATSYQQQQQQPSAGKNGYQGSAGGDYPQQASTIQQQPQMYPQQQQRNYAFQQQQQSYSSYQPGLNQRAVGNNPPDTNRGYGGERNQGGNSYGPNQGNRGNWNAGPSGPPNVVNSGGSGEWGPAGGGGWGDWSGSRNSRRPANDEGPHIPPFPQAWQMGPQQPPLPPGGSRMEQNRGNWSGGGNWKQGWDSQSPPKPPGNNNNSRFSRGDGQQNNRFQNSGRYSPNSRQSRGSAEKSNRELWTPGDAKRGMKDKQGKGKDFQDVDKPIQATEIKSYLYAWLGVRRMRPLYDIHPVGERPDLTFRCELRVNGYKFVGVGEAASKKDAQTDAAWSFAEFLVKQGCLKKADLPPKSKNDDEATDDFGTVKEYEHQKQARPKSNRSRAPRNAPKGPIPLMSIVTSPIGNIPPFPAFERPSEAWGPPRRGPPGPWIEGPSGPWRGGHRGGYSDAWKQRDLDEEHWLEEHQHPEDIFISRMIMNQQEATMAARRLESKPGEWTSVTPARSRNVTTLDDRHVMSKHAAIYPHEEELKAVHQVVTIAERALKALSDQFVDEDHPIAKDDDDDATEDEEEEEVKKEEETEEDKKEDAEKAAEKKSKIQILKRPKKRPRRFPDTRPRVLCAVNRVGTLAKGLLIHDDLSVCLVLLCGIIPTKPLLQRIIKHLPAKLEDVNKDFKYELHEEEGGFEIVGHFEVTVKLSVTLTSTSLKPSSGKERQEKERKKESDSEEKTEQKEENTSEEKNEEEKDPEKKPVDESEYLPKPLLLGALAKLRHAKWFQARASQQDGGVVITRILRNLKMRNPIWNPLTDWALENLLYVALSSSTEHMSPGDALRRFFEVVAGGVFLKDRSGIQDPCEKEEVDILDCCTEQQLEDMTRHAQNCLLKIAFRKVHEVLDMEKIVLINRLQQHPQTASSTTTDPVEEEVEEREGGRKRRLEHNSSDSLAESPKRSLTDEEDTDTQQNLAELTISGPNTITPIEEVAEDKNTNASEDKHETNQEEVRDEVTETKEEPMETDI